MPLPNEMLPRELRRKEAEVAEPESHQKSGKNHGESSSSGEDGSGSSSDDIADADDPETSSVCTDTSETDLTEWRKTQASSENKARGSTVARS